MSTCSRSTRASRLHRPTSNKCGSWISREHRYLPYCEEIVTLTGKPRKKPSTGRGYKQVWNQHLKAHFGNVALWEYEPFMGTQFLQSLTSTQSI
jgi:hypothetical protein